ncbi:MAG: PP2C family serine/threonine-protein phosphatase [Polyangiaceae bacterium]
MRTRFAGNTDVGLQRDHNEDSFLVMPEYRVVAVADGMGGHRSGDVASAMAVGTLQDFFSMTVGRDGTWPFPADPNLTDEENYVVTGLRLANRRIFDRSLKTTADFGMGTTAVAALFCKGAERVTIGHVGDSRCYRLRGEEILQLTRDHSLISDAAYMAPWMSEEEVRQLPPNVITRALGIREDVLVDLVTDETRVGDVYLLCSDGLTGLVSDDQIHEVVVNAKDLETACVTLIERANFFGGSDNITVVLAKVEAGEDPTAAPSKPATFQEPTSEKAEKAEKAEGAADTERAEAVRKAQAITRKRPKKKG